MMIKEVKKARVTTCKRAVCTAPVDGHTKKPKPAPLLETPHTMPKEQIKGSIPAAPAKAAHATTVPATVGTVAHHKPVQKVIYTIAGKRAVIASCRKIKPENLQITRKGSLENITIDGLFS